MPDALARARTRWCRSAATSRTTPGRSPRSRRKLGLEGRAGAGEVGRLAGLASTTGSATSCCRGSWAPRSGSTRPASASASRTAGTRRSTDVEARGGMPYAHSGRRLRPPARRARVRQLGRRGASSRSAELGVFFDTDRRVHRHRVHARRDDRRLRRPGPAAPGDRHRRVGEARRRPAIRSARIARGTAELIGLGRDCATTRSPCWRAGPATSTASRSSRRWTRSGSPGGWRA